MNLKLSIIFLFVVSCNLYSQDTIKFTNKQVLAAKVDEIGTTEIHYHRYDNLTGPKYVVDKNKVYYIKYSNGQIDSFQVAKTTEVVTEPFIVYNPKANNNNLNADKIIISHNKLYYHQRALGEKPLLKLISTYPDDQKKRAMLKEYLEMKTFQRRQYTYGFGGVGAALILVIVGGQSNNVNTALACILIGVPVVIITSQVISGMNKKKRTKKKLEIAKMYNE